MSDAEHLAQDLQASGGRRGADMHTTARAETEFLLAGKHSLQGDSAVNLLNPENAVAGLCD